VKRARGGGESLAENGCGHPDRSSRPDASARELLLPYAELALGYLGFFIVVTLLLSILDSLHSMHSIG